MKFLQWRTPYFYLASLWLCLVLVGANLAIDILAIPLNFKLPEHTHEVAAAYGLSLFSTFFHYEGYALQGLILLMILAPKGRTIGVLDGLRLAATFGFVSYLFYQRGTVLPQFLEVLKTHGDTVALHEQLRTLETVKLGLLVTTAVLCHFSYFGAQARRAQTSAKDDTSSGETRKT